MRPQYCFRVARKPLVEGEKLERTVAYLPTSVRVWAEKEAAMTGKSFSGFVREGLMRTKRRQEAA